MRGIFFGVLFATVAFGQLDDNTLTVTSAQNVRTLPDQLFFSVSLSLSQNSTLDDAVRTLQSAGVVATDLAGLSSSYNNVPLNVWIFRSIVPQASLAGRIALLQKIQSALEAMKNGQDLSFSVYAQTSKQLLAAQPCAKDVLFADARARALVWASAAGVGLGPVVSVSDGGGSIPIVRGFAALAILPIPTAAYRAADFIGLSSEFIDPTVNSVPACALTVQFKLIR